MINAKNALVFAKIFFFNTIQSIAEDGFELEIHMGPYWWVQKAFTALLC